MTGDCWQPHGHGSTRAMQDPAQVTWWTEPDDLEFKQQARTNFKQSIPDIQIIMEPISGEDRDRVIATALQAGAGPDIVPSRDRPTPGPLPRPDCSSISTSMRAIRLGGEAAALGAGHRLTRRDALSAAERDGMHHPLYGQKQFDEKGWTPPTNRRVRGSGHGGSGQGIIPMARVLATAVSAPTG